MVTVASTVASTARYVAVCCGKAASGPVSGVESKAFRRLFLASAYSRKNSRLKSRLLLPAFAPIGTASASASVASVSVSEERCFFAEAALFLFLLSLPYRC